MWKETTEKVVRAILDAHKNEMEVFGSCTDSGMDYMDSDGSPEVMTEWGFKGAEKPLIKAVNRKEYPGQPAWKYKYYIKNE